MMLKSFSKSFVSPLTSPSNLVTFRERGETVTGKPKRVDGNALVEEQQEGILLHTDCKQIGLLIVLNFTGIAAA